MPDDLQQPEPSTSQSAPRIDPTRPVLVIDRRPGRNSRFGHGNGKPDQIGGRVLLNINFLCRKTEPEVRAIADDDKQPMHRRISAKALLAMGKMDHNGMRMLFQVIEHTNGRALQRVEVASQDDGAVAHAQATFDKLRLLQQFTLGDDAAKPESEGDAP